MIENERLEFPFPFTETATPRPLRPLDAPGFLERMLEDAAGLAGVIAAAAQQPETDERDICYAAPLLSEWLHATVTYWQHWQKSEEEERSSA
jgi:hypothetical protein